MLKLASKEAVDDEVGRRVDGDDEVADVVEAHVQRARRLGLVVNDVEQNLYIYAAHSHCNDVSDNFGGLVVMASDLRLGLPLTSTFLLGYSSEYFNEYSSTR